MEKIESKTHLFPKQKIAKRQNKSNNFGNLIGQSSHVPMFLTTSARFELVGAKINLEFGAVHSRNTTAKYGRIYSNRKHLSPNEISTFTIFQYTKLSMNVNLTSHIQKHTFSQRADAYGRYYVLFSFRAYIHTYICK